MTSITWKVTKASENCAEELRNAFGRIQYFIEYRHPGRGIMYALTVLERLKWELFAMPVGSYLILKVDGYGRLSAEFFNEISCGESKSTTKGAEP